MDYTSYTCREFVEKTATSAPTPGGGGACALVGALGTSLGNMVGSLTVGKKKYAEVQQDIKELMEKTTALQQDLLSLINKDAEAFSPLASAYRLPSETDEEKAHKAQVMETALESAALAPLEIMEKCAQGILLLKEFGEKGTVMAVSDAGVGIIFCRSALMGASLNVSINTRSMKNRELAKSLDERSNALLGEYVPIADEVFAKIQKQLGE